MKEVEIIGSCADVLIKERMDDILNRMTPEQKMKFVNSQKTLEVISCAIIREHHEQNTVCR